MENPEDVENNIKLFKKLEERRRTLELKISERCFELKKLCIAEAELTGIIPMEIPLDPDESPPKIKKRIGTMFPFSEDVIHQLQPPSLPSLGKSPKRKTPFCPWNKGSSESLPSRSSEQHSPRQHTTWAGRKNSPVKHPSQRSQIYKAKLNVLKKWWDAGAKKDK